MQKRKERKLENRATQMERCMGSCLANLTYDVLKCSRREPMAHWRPMLPKQTHAQKRTLATQVRTATPSCVMPVASPYSRRVWFNRGIVDAEELVEGGTKSGRSPRMMPIPVKATVVDITKPVLVRSIRYHRTGLTRARVADACVMDCQGSRR